MQVLDAVLALAAFLGLCIFFNRRCGIAGGRTPLLTAALIMLWLTVFGVAGALRCGGWLLYLLSAAAWVLAFLPKKELLSPSAARPVLFDFGFSLFCLLSAVTLAVFAVRQPQFAEWDELSFWGTAAKLLKLNDALYTTATVGWDWVGAQQPGAILSGYFFQFFGSFAPWKTFLGYDVLLYAAYAAVLSAISGTRLRSLWRQYPLALAGALLCVLCPFFLTEYCRLLQVANTYMSAYGDIPAGIFAGGAVAWYFAARGAQDGAHGAPSGAPGSGQHPLPPAASWATDGFTQNSSPAQGVLCGGMWGVFPILAAAGLIKENAFPVALVAAGLVAADTLFVQKSSWPRRLAFAVGALGAPVAAYLVWSRHVAVVVALREAAGEVGATNLSTLQVVVLGFRQLLFAGERTPRFLKAARDMLSSFVTVRLSLLGTPVAVVAKRVFGADSLLATLPGTPLWGCLACTMLFILATVFCRQKRQRLRTVLAAVLSALGFIGYYWVLLLSYAFIFNESQAAVLTDYNRYVNTYFLFWFLLALTHLLLAASAERGRRWLCGGALGLAVLALGVTASMVRPQMSALAFPETTFREQQDYADSAQLLSEQVKAAGLPGTIFFVSTQDNGLRYFTYCYQLLPLQLDFSFGGGPLGSAENDDGSLYYHALSCEELRDYLSEHGCDYIFLDRYDAVFADEYAPLFADGLAAADAGAQLYMRVEGQTLQYAPVGGDAS